MPLMPNAYCLLPFLTAEAQKACAESRSGVLRDQRSDQREKILCSLCELL